MATYQPPDDIDPIFNPFNFKKVEEQTLTPSTADKLYLKYPNAQGTENMATMNVGGVATFLNEAIFNDPVEINNTAVITGDTTFNEPVGNTSEVIFNEPVEINETLTVNQTTTIVNDVLNNSIANLRLENSSTGGVVNFLTSTANGDYSYGVQEGQEGIAFNSSAFITVDGSQTNSVQLNPNQVALWAGGSAVAQPTSSITTDGTNNILNNDTGYTIVNSSNPSQSTLSTFNVKDTTTGNLLSFLMNPTASAYNPMTQQSIPIISNNTLDNSSNLLITVWSATSTGLKISPSSILMGAGGSSSTPTSSVNCNGSTVEVAPSITYPTGRVQNDAFTGAGNLTGSYTNTNMTVNSNGQITALSNGTSSVTPTLPSSWCYYENYTGAYPPTVNFQFNGASWGQNDYFTVQFQIGMEWGTKTNGYYPNYSSLVGYVDFYPWRVAGGNSTPISGGITPANINNSIDGNSSYNYNNATYAPRNRYYWTYGTSFQGASQGVYLYSNSNQGTIAFIIPNPNGSYSNLPFNLSQSYTIVNKGNGQSITMENLNAYTYSGSYGF